MADLVELERAMAQLVTAFASSPMQFFSEREMQAEFYGLCRGRFGSAKPKDRPDLELLLFRHEYNTLGRYRRDRRAGSFRAKFSDEGKAGALDFVILNPEFVSSNELLAVINKHERRRAVLRNAGSTRAIDVGIEFKMAHVREALSVTRSAVTDLVKGFLEDCRKLAHERPVNAYALVFSHGPGPDAEQARRMLGAGASELAGCGTDARLLVATPTATYLTGAWTTPSAFPSACSW